MRLDLKKIPFVKEKQIPWIIWSIAGCYYLYEIILRMLPGTMTLHLMHVLRVTATQLGIFTAFYYFAYIIMQVPAGIIIDRFSIRKTLFTACILCIAGFIIAHATSQIIICEFGRFIVGFGSAFAYVTAIKVASIWLPAQNFGLAACILDSIGMLGAIFTEIVFVRINASYGYQFTTVLVVIVGIIIALLIQYVLKDNPDQKIRQKKYYEIDLHDRSKISKKLNSIIKNPQIWLIGFVGCLFYLPSSVVGDLWGIPYLKAVYHFSHKDAAIALAVFFAGWTLAGPFLGAWSDHLQRRCLPITISLVVNAILFSIIIFAPQLTHHLLPHSILLVILFAIGVATGTHPLIFALAKENYPNKMTGTVVSITNSLVMLGGLVFQPLVGVLLDLGPHQLLAHGIRHYTANDYTIALSIIPLSLITCIILMMFIKETGHTLKKEPPHDDLYIIHKKITAYKNDAH